MRAYPAQRAVAEHPRTLPLSFSFRDTLAHLSDSPNSKLVRGTTCGRYNEKSHGLCGLLHHLVHRGAIVTRRHKVLLLLRDALGSGVLPETQLARGRCDTHVSDGPATVLIRWLSLRWCRQGSPDAPHGCGEQKGIATTMAGRHPCL